MYVREVLDEKATFPRRFWRALLRYASRELYTSLMTTRPVLAVDKMSPEVHAILASFHRGIVDEVAATVARDPVVVVGMAQNPVVKAARKLLDQEGMTYTYLEYGSYFSKWKERLAIKLWAGFGTFPMVFINGVLVGGHSELVKLKADGKLKK